MGFKGFRDLGLGLSVSRRGLNNSNRALGAPPYNFCRICPLTSSTLGLASGFRGVYGFRGFGDLEF